MLHPGAGVGSNTKPGLNAVENEMWMPMAMLEVMLASSGLLWALVDGESMCTFIFVFLKQIESCALALYVHWHDSIYLIKAVLMATASFQLLLHGIYCLTS